MSKNVAVQDLKTKHRRSTRVRQFLIITTAALLAIPVGCTSSGTWSRNALADALVVSYRDMVWAKRAFNLRYGNCDRPYAQHFENGFCAGYAEMCGGGDGYTPALPPEDYRGYEYQTADGAKCINSWFEGYPAGVAAAKKDNAGTYHDVLISRMINSAIKQDNTEAKLPSQVPVVQANGSQTTQRAQPASYTPRPVDPTYDYMRPANTLPPIVAPKGASTSKAVGTRVAQADYEPTPGNNAPLPMGASAIQDTDGPAKQ
jgi:hypothetical protein